MPSVPSSKPGRIRSSGSPRNHICGRVCRKDESAGVPFEKPLSQTLKWQYTRSPFPGRGPVPSTRSITRTPLGSSFPCAVLLARSSASSSAELMAALAPGVGMSAPSAAVAAVTKRKLRRGTRSTVAGAMQPPFVGVAAREPYVRGGRCI
eukprot:7084580-Prymnesium_polylepis.1